MTHELHLGKPNDDCAGCRLTFDSINRSTASVRISHPIVPMVFFEYRICGKCTAMLKTEGADRDGVLAGINAFHEGEEADQ